VGANRPDNFRPISLQNCCLKIHSKCLNLRLWSLIPFLVHPDQTGLSLADPSPKISSMRPTLFKLAIDVLLRLPFSSLTYAKLSTL
jgi:hypothetical protein